MKVINGAAIAVLLATFTACVSQPGSTEKTGARASTAPLHTAPRRTAAIAVWESLSATEKQELARSQLYGSFIGGAGAAVSDATNHGGWVAVGAVTAAAVAAELPPKPAVLAAVSDKSLDY